MTHGRYRVLFSVDEEELANGDLWIRVKVTVFAVGIRKERDKRDVYQVAQKLVEMGIIPSRVVD
jgi:hypothetical protein